MSGDGLRLELGRLGLVQPVTQFLELFLLLFELLALLFDELPQIDVIVAGPSDPDR